MKRTLFCLVNVIGLAALGTGTAAALIYKWTGADGTVHYSDQRRSGAKELKLDPPMVVPALRPREKAETKAVPEPAVPDYRKVEVNSPAAEATIWDSSGRVDVQLMLDPPLQSTEGHKALIMMDGREAGHANPSGTLVLENVDRGAHSIQVRILDQAGQMVAESPEHTFYLHRFSRRFIQRRR